MRSGLLSVVPLTALNAAHVGAVDIQDVRERLLAQSLSFVVGP